ncbi:MAG: hypothetical protein JST16_05180 [Bdellovibrionales bacterium]|nr:hypothetical protein [Bdellovibrionales bacterium]
MRSRILAAFLFLVPVTAGILYFMGAQKAQEGVAVLLKPQARGTTLDPSKIMFIIEYDYIRTLSARLIGTEKDGTYRNELAESISFDPTKTLVKIALRKAQYSDGSPITARDVEATFKRLILRGSSHTDPKAFIKGATKLTKMSDSIEGIRVLDDKTLQLELNYPIKELIYYFQLADYGILHPSQYSKDLLTTEDWTKAVSGPYRLEWNGTDKYVFLKNELGFGAEENLPARVEPVRLEGDALVHEMKDRKLHFGGLTFADYLKVGPRANEFPQIKFFGFQENLILHLDLNIKSKLFSDPAVRQWIRKRIHRRLSMPSDVVSGAMKKATQFFIPNSKGYLADTEIDEILSGVSGGESEKIPAVLKNGFTVRTIATMNNYLPPGLEKIMSDALGVPVKISLDVKREDFSKFAEERKFDATIMATAMDYKVLGEALNFMYLSSPSPMLDPTGGVRKLLKEYHAEDEPDKETALVRKILRQMTTDSELIPLYYLMAPYFYDSNKLDVSQVNILESLQIWKVRGR